MSTQLQSIPFNKVLLTGKEQTYIEEVLKSGNLAGGGAFGEDCVQLLQSVSGSARAILTHSCTAALEMSALVLDLEAGDEVIMPSYTFTSTANAFALRGARPVFVDIREDTLNLDENLLEQAITSKTRAIVPVHYAGVACEMDEIVRLADQYGLAVIEDAAQGILSTYNGRHLGTIGEMGALSFHATKNIVSGEGGALLINAENYVEPAELAVEKGTDRSRFLRGSIDKYTWRSLGSSYLPSELVAACLKAQLENAEATIADRRALWENYHSLLEPYERAGLLRRPVIPAECRHNAHMYYVLLPSQVERQAIINAMRPVAQCVSHFEPLHLSAFAKSHDLWSDLPVTENIASRILRLPLWNGLGKEPQKIIVSCLAELLAKY